MKFNKSNLIQFVAIALFVIFLIMGSSGNHNVAQPKNETENSNGIISSEQTAGDSQQQTELTNEQNNKEENKNGEAINNANNLYSVVRVVDGDTLVVNIDGKEETLRLIGIDTPETVDPRKAVQCFGLEASNKAKDILSGKKISLENDPTQGDRDKYERLLRYVFLEDGTNFNLYMIKEGYAYEYTYNTPYKYQTEFKGAQKSAQENQKGLWSSNTCNGETTLSTTPNITPVPSQTTTTNSSAVKYYTSSYRTAKYYYPASCQEWQSLSPSYLKAFDSLEALLEAYPSRTLSPQCQ
jgi:micrococcal nuclease